MDYPGIPYTQLPHVSRLFTDYLYHYPRVSEFYPLNPFQEESFSQAARSLQYSDALRREVVAVLQEQNQRFSAGEQTLDSLARLQRPDCFAVVTGQQAGLFTGPAFAIYKALTAIKVARTLSQRGLPAVAVFWLATEDHDLAEVNHCYIQDRDGNPQQIAYSENPSVEDAPVGSIQFTEAIQASLEGLRAFLPESSDQAELVENLSECYRPGESFGTAFGRFMARLFADYGVVLVDPLDARLHSLSSHVFRTAIESSTTLVGELIECNRRLLAGGYHAQVRVTENSSLLFYYADGQRVPLRLRDGQFVSPRGQTYSAGELLAQLQQRPGILSPNVLLRPVMQDALLPTIAYVGGPSELAYLAQAAPVYQRVLGRMPVLLPRASFTILEQPTNRLLTKYGLTLLDVCAGKQALREKMAAHFLPPALTEVFRKATTSLDASLEEIQKALAQLDPTLVDAAAHSGRKMHYQLSTVERKAAAAAQSRSEQVERDALRLENSLYPHKALQERLYSGINYLARYGPQFLTRIYEQINLNASDHQLVVF